jgi:hypothetical protein
MAAASRPENAPESDAVEKKSASLRVHMSTDVILNASHKMAIQWFKLT